MLPSPVGDWTGYAARELAVPGRRLTIGERGETVRWRIVELLLVLPLALIAVWDGARVAIVRKATRGALEAGGYLIRGDNAPEGDGLVPLQDILGLVTRVERNGRRVLLGRGPERRLLAFLVRRDLLQPLLFRVRQVLRPLRRRSPA